MRIYEELPCGCLVSEDGGGGLIPCCYTLQEKTELHKRCMELFFKQNKTVSEIKSFIEKEK